VAGGYEMPEKRQFDHVPMRLLDAARTLRTGMTDAEHLLWFCLRRNQLAGFGFRRQHPMERYVLDFFCCEAKLVVELDGGQHNEDAACIKDLQRTEFLEQRGIVVVRFWNNEVFQNLEGVLERIYNVLLERVGPGRKSFPPP
jgi:very-short-patch-repair endonuclease